MSESAGGWRHGWRWLARVRGYWLWLKVQIVSRTGGGTVRLGNYLYVWPGRQKLLENIYLLGGRVGDGDSTP